MTEVYTKEDLQMDMNWLMGHGITKKEAKQFIMSLLNRPKLIK